ncbi:MAG: NUDIX hydrolase [Bacteroidales bacterium]|nr:NUDIX hydrolase [Bacteroidales bacterium]
MDKNYTYKPGDTFPFQYRYEHMGVTTDCVIFTYEDWKLKVLLVRRGGEPFKGKWAFPGGFLKMDENAEQGALRELREETALEPSAIAQLGVFSDVHRDPRERVITIAWYALVKPHEVVGGDDADEAAWFPVDDLPPLAFDHRQIFEAAMERLRRDIHFQPVGFDLLDEEFTIPDLQRLYEAILGVKFDRRNFQRKILASGILDSVGKEETDNSLYCCFEDSTMLSLPTASVQETAAAKKGRQGRHGILFRFNRKKYEEMKEDGGKMEF